MHQRPVALLNVAKRERRHLGAPQSATKQDRENSAITQAFVGGDIWRVQDPLRLLCRQPVSKPDAF
jgi:hypothetical protein